MAEDGELDKGDSVKTTFMIVGNTLRSVQYTVVENQAVVEGCIVIGTAKEAETNLKKVQDNPGLFREDISTQGAAISGQGFLWPEGGMIYEVHEDLPDQHRVHDAIAHWEAKTPIRFIKRDPSDPAHNNYVAFVPGSGCRSAVGRRGGRQELVLGANCKTGNTIHEIGHALGLWHEQSRSDRDAYVRIRYDRIESGTEHNFSQHIHDGIDVEKYDLGSIMHYPLTAFSIDGRPTIELVNNDYEGVVGQREGLSKGDVETIKKLYKSEIEKRENQ
ncbi:MULTISPECIES: M12 family metallopeptidase [unclassified Ensifer]|uniref:M12 family metallopeptidase n=1 Tax=unclassified Ensifer TaxID=2633371 RepID=UPI00070A3C7D|nr:MULTISPECIES: M12 family metallopeptidase [unclassified Ensifer]KQW43169.1 hypothetical protein ASD02_35400 [Ensifer sp. Root1252]KRC67107.1 hypothetical protein ASE32_35630 [Ensifer sp. Root231]KRC93686.1 hypothetical protein ASE47_35485 [Ensifer sp. Root258]